MSVFFFNLSEAALYQYSDVQITGYICYKTIQLLGINCSKSTYIPICMPYSYI